MRIYSLDPDTYQLLDYENYYLDLERANGIYMYLIQHML